MTATLDRTFLEQWRHWHAEREDELREPYGWLSLTALHWLDEQARVLDGLPGAWSAGRRAARVTATEDEGLVVDDRLLDGTTQLSIHEAGSSLFAAIGDRRLELIRRDGRYGIRVRDPKAAALARFGGVPTFDVDPAWVTPARFELYRPPRVTMVDTAQEGLLHRLEVVGLLRFGLGGTEHTLVATAGRGSELTVLFSDATSGQSTAPWRSLAVPRPKAGHTVLDFNRAVNQPFAFSDHGTCPRPPEGNHLPVPVEAGERTPRPVLRPLT